MTLKLEVGKRYITRDGGGPCIALKPDPNVGLVFVVHPDATRLHRADGTLDAFGRGPHPLDLISEYIDPPVLSGPGPLLAVLLERPAKVAADTPEIVLREGVACYGAKARIDHDGDLRIVGDNSGKCSVAGEALREFHSWLGQHLSRAGDPL